MAEVADLLGIRMTCTTPYHPQSDGQVERFNWTLGSMMATVVAPDQMDWDLHRPFLMGAYQATRHPAKGFSTKFLRVWGMMTGMMTVSPHQGNAVERLPDREEEWSDVEEEGMGEAPRVLDTQTCSP